MYRVGLIAGTMCALLLLLLPTAGCAPGHGLMSPVLADIGTLLDRPAVQSTLDKWAARGSLHNPRVGGQLTTGFEVYTTGLDVEGEIAGDARSGGIDPERLDRLTQIMERLAEKLGVDTKPKEAPATPTPPAEKPGLGQPALFTADGRPLREYMRTCFVVFLS